MTHQKRNYAILVTGALGGFYGARLQNAGLDVHFLLHRDYEHVCQYGLVVESIEGDLRLPQVKAYRDVEQMPRCDVVVVALKTTQNHLLRHLLPEVVKDDSIVLVLQNGLGTEAEVAQIVGSKRVMGGLCFVCSNKIGPGHICHLDYGAITLADYAPNYRACGITERMRAIASDFEQAGISIDLSESLLAARWRKLVWNIPFNGLSVLLDAMTDELVANSYTRSLIEHLMGEVVAGANACGCEISEEIIQNQIHETIKMKPYRTSMKIDYDQRRPLEVEAIFGNPLQAAQQAGVETPQVAILYQQLKFLDTRHSS